MFLKKGKKANCDMKYPIRAYLEIREIESFSWTHRPSENENRESSFLSMMNILNVPALQFWTGRWWLLSDTYVTKGDVEDFGIVEKREVQGLFKCPAL